MEQRGYWQSRLGFILASAGSAVGLGAIWRFPYVTAQVRWRHVSPSLHFFSLTLGLALLIAETSVGRFTQKGAISATKILGGPRWKVLGYLTVLTGFLIYSFYCVIGGWTLMYLYKAWSGHLLTTDLKFLEQDFERYVEHTPLLIGTQGLYIVLTLLVVVGGVQKGIERVSKVLMPALFVIMIILIIRSVTLDGVWKFIAPDWSKISWESVLAALGLAVFSLSLGTGSMLAYGSYVGKEVDLVRANKWVTSVIGCCQFARRLDDPSCCFSLRFCT